MSTGARRALSNLRGQFKQRQRARTMTVDSGDATVSRREDQALIRSKANPESSRTGLFLYGACDLPALLALAPFLADETTGTTAISSEGIIATTRSDFVLQTLNDLPRDICTEISRRLHLPANCFEPTLFEPTFDMPKLDPDPFKKSVVFLSLGSNVVRTLYRHNEHGVLVDPGGWWLGSGPAKKVTDDETLKWFQASFTSVGRLTPESWQPLFARVVEEVRSRMPAEIVVLNTLTVEPGTQMHNYGLRRNPEGIRRRGFHLALGDLARQLDFRIIDIDRVLKRDGVSEQIDFAHFPAERFEAIAAEGFEVLRNLGAIDLRKAPT